MRLFEFIRKVWNKLMKGKDVKSALGIDVVTSKKMERAIHLWDKMYVNEPPWENETVKAINTPAAIASEVARLVTVEMKSIISGSVRADYLDSTYQTEVINSLRNDVEVGCAMGGIVFKPFVNKDKIEIDIVQADRFYPLSHNSNKDITSGLFDDYEYIGNTRYTKLEVHTLKNGIYIINNYAFKKKNYEQAQRDGKDDIGESCKLDKVDRWADLEEETTFENIENVLFSYFKTPMANNIDRDSPLGVSVYSKAVDVIKEADKQFSRIMWEFESKETLLQVASEVLEKDKYGNAIVPAGKKRLYNVFDIDKGSDGGIQDFMKEWSPDIRDSSMYNGLNKLLQRIEFLCGLAYGTISDPTVFEKTATEINSSKQRSYSTISDLQGALGKALDNLVYAMDTYATIYSLAPIGEYSTSHDWDDSIVVDSNVEYQRRWGMVLAGKMRLEKFYSWYFKCSEEEAMEMIPDNGVTKPSYDELE